MLDALGMCVHVQNGIRGKKQSMEAKWLRDETKIFYKGAILVVSCRMNRAFPILSEHSFFCCLFLRLYLFDREHK